MPVSNHLPLQYFSLQLAKLFQKAARQKNPALFLYRNKARSLLFMVESLLRLLAKEDGDEKTKQSLKRIKKLEDRLGEIGDCDELFLQFSENESVKEEQAAYFARKRDKKIGKLNKTLLKKEYYKQTFHALSRDTKIDLNDKELVTRFQRQLEISLLGCFDFYKEHQGSFVDIEKHVHEIRRKLRWISIYAQSLNGTVVLDPDRTHYSWEKKFITKNELQSPYNKLPVRKNLAQYIHFNKKAFLALSFVVNELGTIKDKGLAMKSFVKAAVKTSELSPVEATLLVIKQLNLDYTERDLCKAARGLLEEFFMKYRIHELLIKKT
jgi:hypothetical protein